MSEDRAEWRLNPVTERTLAEGRQRERRRRRNVGLLTAAALGLCPLSCLGTCLPLNAGPQALFFGPLALLSVVLLVVVVVRHSKENNAESADLLALRDEFSGVGGWLVEMSVYQGEALSGRDIGVVWFQEERLYFTGARTSFGLGTNDLRGTTPNGNVKLDGISNLLLPLDASGSMGAAIGLKFVGPEREFNPAMAEGSYRNALRGWLASGAKTSGQLPPFSLGPELPTTRSLRIRAVFATAAWPFLGLLALVAAGWGGAALASFLVLGLAIVVQSSVWRPRQCWRALRDRQRLEAYNKDQ